MNVTHPFVLYTGDASDYKQAKTAFGVYEWTDKIICQLSSSKYPSLLDFDVPKVSSLQEARIGGAVTLLLGYSPTTRDIPESFRKVIKDALSCGLNVASGMHSKLADDPEFKYLAETNGVQLFDFRHREQVFPKGNGVKRSGKRLLTVGLDCACGKKYTALALHKNLFERGVNCTFRSTGQTGYLISNSGINNDTIEADFLSGAAEWLSPANAENHLDIIEGQGALSHPSFGGGSLSLIHGSQPDYMVMCVPYNRVTMRGVDYRLPFLQDEMELATTIARRTNHNARFVGISVSFADAPVSKELRSAYIAELHRATKLPVFDPSDKTMLDDFVNGFVGGEFDA